MTIKILAVAFLALAITACESTESSNNSNENRSAAATPAPATPAPTVAPAASPAATSPIKAGDKVKVTINGASTQATVVRVDEKAGKVTVKVQGQKEDKTVAIADVIKQ